MWVLACVANGIVIKRQQSLAEELLSLAENGEETLFDALKSHLPEDYGFLNDWSLYEQKGVVKLQSDGTI